MAWKWYLLAVAIFALVPTGARSQDRPAGEVVAVVGMASVVRTNARETLRKGTRLAVGDRIVTGAGARVSVRLIGGATLIVGPRSEVRMRSADRWGRRRTVAMTVIFGIVRTVAPPTHRSALEIWTSTAIASVRHTVWIVSVTARGTAVFAAEGTVDVRDRRSGKVHVLSQGNGVDLLNDGRTLGPRSWGAGRVQRVLAATTAP